VFHVGPVTLECTTAGTYDRLKRQIGRRGTGSVIFMAFSRACTQTAPMDPGSAHWGITVEPVP
jgi:hypothetical protein